jgi:hypothetical protein
VPDVLEELLEDLLGDLCLSDFLLLDGFAVGGLLGGALADAASEEVLAAVDDEGSVVDCVDLLAHEHHAHASGHSHGDVVDQESYRLCHLKKC